MDCRICGKEVEYMAFAGAPALCDACSSESLRQHNAIKKLVSEGHTEHCAERMTWGDGECECFFKCGNCSEFNNLCKHTKEANMGCLKALRLGWIKRP